MKNHKLRTITATVLTLILVFALFVPVLRIPVFADDIDACYYFSDYAPSQDFYEAEIEGAFQRSRLYYYGNGQFANNFVTNYTNGIYDGISNAYVIFEIRNGLGSIDYDPNDSAYDTQIPTLLHIINFFTELKSRGCKIMLISGIHRVRIAEYEYDLLSNVDVHVDVAVWDRFILTVFYKIWDEDASPHSMDNTTIVLDSALSGDSYESSWFVNWYIFPIIRSIYREEFKDNDIAFSTSEQRKLFCRSKNIKIIYYLGDNDYYDYTNEISVSTESGADGLFNLINNNRVFAIGSSSSGSAVINEWAEDMYDLKVNFEMNNLQTYVYNIDGYDLSQYTSVKTTPSHPDVTDIMRAFIYDNTTQLERFDNDPSGISEITYNFMFGLGPDESTWLLEFRIGGGDFYIDWCQTVLYYEVYDYFFDDGVYPYEDVTEE